MPPDFLAGLPDPRVWSDRDAMDWANKLRVSCHALGIALLEAKLIDGNRSQEIQLLRVPREEKWTLNCQTPSSQRAEAQGALAGAWAI